MHRGSLSGFLSRVFRQSDQVVAMPGRLGDSCAAAIATKATQKTKVTIWKGRPAIFDLSIISPVHVRKNVVPPFVVAQKFFIEIICDKLIVQTVETSKVIDRALSGVFAGRPGFH